MMNQHVRYVGLAKQTLVVAVVVIVVVELRNIRVHGISCALAVDTRFLPANAVGRHPFCPENMRLFLSLDPQYTCCTHLDLARCADS